ncbi:hypothetical protein M413DRAFT_258573 [Hebeloma cylindrosporum]|uniref:DUF6533 domain-containing protein n=1 Tax=Hebeloma cylindrosporum TaxID=76867 RepID=A0A0C2XIK2_HEBCY|nr:hypothetical protein M413DRAFT_258573 [Hebeloma cylindrosporum h7]
MLTFRMEVELVWGSKWNFMKGLYLFQRYLPFIDTVWLVLYHQTGTNLSPATCGRLYYASGAMMVAGFASSEMILTLRAWAVWNRSTRLAVILVILYICLWSSNFVLLGIFLSSVTFGKAPFPGFTGCLVTHANHFLIYTWSELIAWDALVLVLMLIPGIGAYRSGGNSALMKAVYRDGAIYYLYLFTLSAINIVVVSVLPPQYQHLLTSAERVLHSMLTSRVLLHIRSHTSESPVWSDGLTELNTNHIRAVGDFQVNSQAQYKSYPTIKPASIA